MKNKFGERLKELRLEKGFSQSELAEQLEFSKSAIENWELANRHPDLDTIIFIAQYFGVTTDYLFGLED